MRRKLIRTLIIIGVLFALMALAVRIFISPEAVKQFLFAELEARTGIHAEAEDASIQFPWPVGLRLKGLRLSTPEDGANLGVRMEARVEEALATADLMSLFRKAPQVQEVRLQHPQLELWLLEGEEAQIPPEETPDGSAVASPGGERAGIAVALSLLSIDDGNFVIHQLDGSTTTVEGVRQRVHFQIDEQKEFSGRLESSVSALRMEGGPREAPLQLGEMSAELLVSGTIEPLILEVQVPSWAGEGLRGEGRVFYELRENRAFVESELEWSADVEEVLRRVRESSAQQDPDPLAGYEISLESLAGSARFKGFLPEDNQDPSAWLSLIELEGNAEGLRLGALGQTDLVRGRSGFRLEGESVVLEPLELHLEGLDATGRIAVPALGTGSLDGRLTLQVDSAALEKRARSLWPALPDSVRENSTPPEEWPELAGAISGDLLLQLPMPAPEKLPPGALRVSLALEKLNLTQRDRPAPIVLSQGAMQLDPERLTIDRLRVETEGLQGGVEGVLDGWPESMRFVGEGRFALLDLDLLSPPKGEVETSQAWWRPAVAHAKPESKTFVPPENLEIHMGVQADRVLTRGYVIRDLKSQVDLSERLLQFRDIDGKMGTGRLVGTASVDWTEPEATWTTRIEAIEIPASEVLAPVAPRLGQALQTSLSGMLALNGDLLDDQAQLLRSLSGGGALKGTAGELLTTLLLGDGLNALPGQAAQKLSVINFKDFLTTLRFDAGRANFDETILRGPTQVTVEGWAGFDGQVDYALEVKLPPGDTLDLGSFTPLVEFLRTSDDRITIPLHVSGPGKKPKVSLELGAAEERAKDAAKGEIEDKVKGFLKGLGGKKGGG
jgi:hypothetical protein